MHTHTRTHSRTHARAHSHTRAHTRERTHARTRTRARARTRTRARARASNSSLMNLHTVIAVYVYITCLFVQLCTAALRLIVRSWLDVPTFTTRRRHTCHHARAPSDGRWNCGREMPGNFAEMTTSTPFGDLLHAVKLRHGTDGFTSCPKEGMLKIFSP